MNRRKMFVTCLTVAIGIQSAWGEGEVEEGWTKIELAQSQAVKLGGPEGASLERGVARLAKKPYSLQWLLSDVSFEMNRVFNNYSGDVSGRFLELATLTSTPERPQPPVLIEVLKAIVDYQRPDGHFGVDFDLNKHINAKDTALNPSTNVFSGVAKPCPMLWGNARMLVGLVTAAQQFNDPKLMESARKLGDYYVQTDAQLCSPKRLDEYRCTGSGSSGYVTDYFPAIEGLAMLYEATRDGRYLAQAERIAKHFKYFDVLPVDHSHGNLCAYRGLLTLHAITGKREYLDRSVARWKEAVGGGYVWPVGGVGEKWHVFYKEKSGRAKDEGCSESDWLRFNLELWRQTGETQYLQMAERLLHNHLAANQCASGGYGIIEFEGDDQGPVAMLAPREAPFCCSFHGPLALHFLKRYLAAGSEQGIYVTLPLSFEAPVHAGGSRWHIAVTTTPSPEQGQWKMVIEALPQGKVAKPIALWVRAPEWADAFQFVDEAGACRCLTPVRGYLKLTEVLKQKEKFEVRFAAPILIEGRRFQTIRPTAGQISHLKDVSLVAGPSLLYTPVSQGGAKLTLLVLVDDAGHIKLPRAGSSMALSGNQLSREEIRNALGTAPPVSLVPIEKALTPRPSPLVFVYDLVVMPEGAISGAESTQLGNSR